MSRLAMGLIGVMRAYLFKDLFTEAVAKKIYYGPVCFRHPVPSPTDARHGRRRLGRRRQRRRCEPEIHQDVVSPDQGLARRARPS